MLGSFKGSVSFETGYIGKPILEEMRPTSSLTGMFSDRLLRRRKETMFVDKLWGMLPFLALGALGVANLVAAIGAL